MNTDNRLPAFINKKSEFAGAMGQRVIVYSWIVAAIGAAFWLFAALLVAYPKHFFANGALVEFSYISSEFLGEEWLERIFLPLLILTDVAIDFFIHHFADKSKNEKMKRRITMPIIVFGLLYIVASGIIPNNNPEMSGDSKDLVMAFALFFLFVIRWVSLVPITIFHEAT